MGGGGGGALRGLTPPPPPSYTIHFGQTTSSNKVKFPAKTPLHESDIIEHEDAHGKEKTANRKKANTMKPGVSLIKPQAGTYREV